MQRTVDIALPPREAADPGLVREAAAEACGMALELVRGSRILKRSIDARSKQPLVRLRVEVSTEAGFPEPAAAPPDLPDASTGKPVIIVGCGPAGLFAALGCIRRGLRPILLERGKDVRARRRDLAAINREHVVDPDSNYCFGEGGAGTYSDGKLYTRSDKRGDIMAVLETFVAFGAPPDILVDAHPHIGTNKLPRIITAMRESIEGAGGEVRFNTRVTDLVLSDGRIHGVRTAQGEELLAEAVVLATGHSARDIFELLHAKGIAIEAKPFAMGVRIEHPQEVIDRIRYHCDVRDPFLPPASYNAVQQVEGRGVYSFCMCPGGIIAPCATAPGEVVTNGWSPSKRNNPFANSGIVVAVDPPMLPARSGGDPLRGMYFQQQVEQAAWRAGGQCQRAPAQRLEDFIRRRSSTDLPTCSYPPGIVPCTLDQVLPAEVAVRLRGGLKAFGEKMRGYRTNEAVLVAVESRTSSPVRIPRDPHTLQHPQVHGLYPCAEGAGYAGGIVSAAMDGLRVAQACLS
ncbi:MAG: FAD-dependent oxidoreductase [Flavobacteriales bacterium]|nr:FAD-dependent oxidoreductase [Flavobacteriales bacterium]MBP9078658.1 FAD-dependent oxidoreductase [Flavobacteriales bacterium]